MDEFESLKKKLDSISATESDLILRKGKEDDFPESYKTNTEKEKMILSCCENFRRQFVHLFRDRKPLLLCPMNEAGVQPSVIASPATTINRQKGNCFEMSIVLCSLLIGAGYDAYCVCGYATREITLMDQTRDACPLLKLEKKEAPKEKKKEPGKYTVKPPKDLVSKFEAKIAAKIKEEEDALQKKLMNEEAAKIAELEKPPPDKLRGLRFHCWVLVLSGKREIPESFFIESTTGESYPLNFSGYLGVESVWNNLNCWVNMQDCTKGVMDMTYDLGDAVKWEFVFPITDKPVLGLPHLDDGNIYLDDEEEQDELNNEFDLPPSWVDAMYISPQDFESRCPKGKRTILYKKAKQEIFPDYSKKDGLVMKLSSYADYELKELVEMAEDYKHRADKLVRKVYNHKTGTITEYFSPGRLDCLKEHRYQSSSPGQEADRTMYFYSSARIDGLEKQEETPTEMMQSYRTRDDYLYYRHVTFSPRTKEFGPTQQNHYRHVVKIIEKFHRNLTKKADDDVAERLFLLSEERISLVFHLEEDRVTASTRDFVKPAYTDDKNDSFIMTPDMTTTFQVDPLEKPKKNLTVYNMLLSLMKAEEESISQIRSMEDEVKEILKDRALEMTSCPLTISVYDTERNEKAKLHRQELQRKAEEEAKKKHETEMDYLAPFLAQIGNPSQLSRAEAYKLKEECLQDLKQRLIDRANLIQARFEKETHELQQKQAWYQQNQISMTKEDEDDYLTYCSEAMFRIHILEQRLQRHKEMAPPKYMQLEHKLRTDPRLADYF
ncbi:dynein regulatory complex subunit 7-like isoform X2 [Xenia sp. Carnegie-2017]|uniref:dynein regulatory complex subunit 7-like isoform X2 n=1 Tax=Xenia sp. Carnegie-2017 TaxID=2897299 RepID=UPI001F036DC7|nr:dynein regulatory complex subunit 7-like isoform X2 [Xenia sp. Carnegie-2017]